VRRGRLADRGNAGGHAVPTASEFISLLLSFHVSVIQHSPFCEGICAWAKRRADTGEESDEQSRTLEPRTRARARRIADRKRCRDAHCLELYITRA